MKKNMGSTDRLIRLVLAAVVAFLYFKGILSGFLGITLLVIAIVFLLTSVVSFCPVYTLFGITTCKKK